MTGSYQRKKQPQLVRTQLLEAAAHVIVERGLGGLTLDLVAKRAGVSKGGLIHHFPSKQALVEELFQALVATFEGELGRLMDNDPEPRGRFLRAYLGTVLLPAFGAFDSKLLGACALVMITDKCLADAWWDWYEGMLCLHAAEFHTPMSHVIRYAADGLWLESCTGHGDRTDSRRREVVAHLMRLTYGL